MTYLLLNLIEKRVAVATKWNNTNNKFPVLAMPWVERGEGVAGREREVKMYSSFRFSFEKKVTAVNALSSPSFPKIIG